MAIRLAHYTSWLNFQVHSYEGNKDGPEIRPTIVTLFFVVWQRHIENKKKRKSELASYGVGVTNELGFSPKKRKSKGVNSK